MIPKKIKLIFVLLAMGAILSVFSLTDYFKQGKASILSLKNIAGNLSFKIETDSDHDGLNNIDESYWNTDFQNKDTDGDSFLDGEEVASGHDPTVVGPNDLLQNMNLTEKLAELTAAGLYEGSLKPDSIDFDKSLTNLAEYATDNAAIAINNIVSSSTLKLVDSTKENQNRYLDGIYEIIKDFLVAYGKEIGELKPKLDSIGTNGFEDAFVTNYFSSEKDKFASIYDRTKNIEVPQNWQNEHLKLMGEIKLAVESNRAIAAGNKDPIKAAMGLNAVGELLEHIPNWSSIYIQKNRTEEINNSLIESLFE